MTERDAKIEAMARVLCEADGKCDPETLVVYGDGLPPMYGPKGSVVAVRMRPAWHLYVREAIAAIAHAGSES